METAAEAKARRGPKATIRRQLTRVHTPATSTGKHLRPEMWALKPRLCQASLKSSHRFPYAVTGGP